MEIRSDACEHLDVSAEERASQQLIKRILKLRWIGMQDEAEEIRSALQRVAARVTLLAAPRDTH